MTSHFIPPRELLSVFFRDKWRIIAAGIIPVVLAIAVAYMLTPRYEATASILVKTGREFEARAVSGEGMVMPPSVSKAEIINSEIAVLESRGLAQDTIAAIGLEHIYPEIAASGQSDERKFYLALLAFGADLKVQPVRLSNVIDVAFDHEDRATATAVLNKLLELYMAKHVAIYSEHRSKFLEDTIEQYTTQLQALQKQKEGLLVNGNLSGPDDQRIVLINERAAADNTLQQLREKEIDAREKIKFYELELARTPKLMTVQSATSDAIERARAQLIDLQLQESQLASRYTDEAPPLRVVRHDIELVKEFLAKHDVAAVHVTEGANPVYDDMKLNLSRATAERKPIEDRIAQLETEEHTIDDRLHELEQGNVALTEVQRQIDTLTGVLTTYRNRLEEARIDEDLDRAKASSLSLIEQPFASAKAVFPRKTLFAGAGLLLGLLSAVGMFIYLLTFRNDFASPESVERLLALPVLGSMPELRHAHDDRLLPPSGPSRAIRRA